MCLTYNVKFSYLQILSIVFSKFCCTLPSYLAKESDTSSLKWFNFFNLNFHADCSSELVNWMPPPLPRPRCTHVSTLAHPYTVEIPHAKVNQYLLSFIPFTCKPKQDSFVFISSCLRLHLFQERSIKTPLHLKLIFLLTTLLYFNYRSSSSRLFCFHLFLSFSCF